MQGAEPPMDCREFLERYSDYDDSLLSARELSAFRAHLGRCPSCARYDRVLRKGRMLARQLPGPDPDPTLIPRLQQRLGALGVRRSPARTAVPALAAWALAAVTVLMVATSAVALLDRTTVLERGRVAARPLMAAPDATGAGAPPASAAPRVTVGGRTIVLPAAPERMPRAWAAERVDRRLASSYSPLVTGPPAYRAARAYPPGPGSSNRRTLD